MSVLLDTHALLWLIAGDRRASPRAKEIFADRGNTLYTSVASLWEIGIKTSLGKLDLAAGWPDIIGEEMRLNAIQRLPVELPHCAALQILPFHHRDPFDRMLVAQATIEGLSLLSRDDQLRAYDVECLW